MITDYQLRRQRYLAKIKGITGRAPAIPIEQPIPAKGRSAYVPKTVIPAGRYTDRARLHEYFNGTNGHNRGLAEPIRTSKLTSGKRAVVITDAVPSPLGSPELTSYPWIELEKAPTSQPLGNHTEHSDVCSVLPEPRYRLDHTGRCVRV